MRLTGAGAGWRAVVAAACGVVLVATAFPPDGAAVGRPASEALEQFEAALAAPPSEGIRLVLWGGDAPGARPLTDGDLALLRELLTRGAMAPEATDPDEGVGLGLRQTGLAIVPGWSRCYSSALWAITGEPGQSFVVREPAPADVAPEPVCGGNLGSTRTWLDVTMDMDRALYGCADAMVWVSPPLHPQVGGPRCFERYYSAHGNGVVFSYWITFWFAVDVFLGEASVVAAGHDRLL